MSKADALQTAQAYRDLVLSAMNELRATVDTMEPITSDEYWPYPTYADLMFSI